MSDASVGFVGLGVMGQPIALNLVRAGHPLLVWNRTTGRSRALADEGALVAETAAQVFARSSVVILMLANAGAVDDVLGRGSADFGERVANRLIVSMGTTSPAYSQGLETDIRSHGGRYVEAPVSGSRTTAEAGQLVGMLAGEVEAVQVVQPLLKSLCRDVAVCGHVPQALLMKLAVNTFLITQVTGLAESFHLAKQQGLDLEQLVRVLDAGPMASTTMRLKASMMLADDYPVQASIKDVSVNTQLITEAAHESGIQVPLMDVCHDLFTEASALGLGADDMAVVLKALEARESGMGRDLQR
ncbi:NAD(P)-dependent oxidoreductase [Knoellia sp. CPCC 206453]|uniref:NAD(P)-dependent oxidoreductase n=1 Tax=Knoellia pratensis TaxID=3404796 RepID=UPI00360E8CAD